MIGEMFFFYETKGVFGRLYLWMIKSATPAIQQQAVVESQSQRSVNRRGPGKAP
jgi:hypothetical protein